MLKKIYNKNKEVINYLIVGGLTTLVSLIVYYGTTITFLNSKNQIQLQAANILSWIISVTFAYFTNRKYVFESKEKNKIIEASKFVSSRIATLILDMIIMFVGTTLFKLDDKIVKIISQVIVIVSNYLLSKILVFKNKENCQN